MTARGVADPRSRLCSAFRAAGGVPAAVALLAFGPDRRIVRDALAILAALLCGEGEPCQGTPP